MDSHNTPPLPYCAYKGFTNLPNEVLERIALALFEEEDEKYETTDDDSDYGGNNKPVAESISHLSNLQGDANLIRRSGKCNLASFARVDRHIYELVAQILYKKVEISTLVARPFLETVLRNKKLSTLVREITLTFLEYERDDCEKKPLTAVQKAIFAEVLQRVLIDHGLKFDGGDPTSFFESDAPVTEAGLLLYALPNLVRLQFGDCTMDTFDTVFRNGRNISSILFGMCLGNVFSKNPATIPAALLSLESFVLTSEAGWHYEGEGTWDLEFVAPVFFCPKIRLIKICGARSTYPYVTNRDGHRLEGFAPSFRGEVMEPQGPRRHIKETDSDGEEDGLNDQCHMCRKPQIQLKYCSKCKNRTYCSKECQIADWPKHKKACKKEKMHHKFPRKSDVEDRPGSSTLEVLLIDDADLHAKILRKILSRPRALKTFCYVKHPFIDGYDEEGGQGCHLPMKPKLFQLALEAQQNSLETLEVRLRLHYEESLMNLCNFTSLKSLDIEAQLLICRPSAGLGIPIRDTLPKSLEILILEFNSWGIKKPYQYGPTEFHDKVSEGLEFHLRSIAGRPYALKNLRIILPPIDNCGQEEGSGQTWTAIMSMAKELFSPTGIAFDFYIVASPIQKDQRLILQHMY